MCNHPITVFWYGEYLISGKKKLYFSLRHDKTSIPQRMEIPCGQCIGCRLEYSRQWAIRCMMEASCYEDNYFLTLTYSNECLPTNLTSPDGPATLFPDHLKKFLKDLRAYYKYHFDHDKIRFFACGEYGDDSFRPHYHVIFFNLPIFDLEFYKNTFDGNCLYTSEVISKIWKHGMVFIGSVTFESAAYVARYVVKKSTKDFSKDDYKQVGIVPEFVRMSRNPGIARDYLEAHAGSILKYDEVYLGGTRPVVKPPKYFDRLFGETVAFQDNKKRRLRISKISRNNESRLTDKERCFRLADRDAISRRKSAAFIRM